MSEPIYFMGNDIWFRVILVVSNLWQEAGFSAILFSAAISGVDVSLYEAARSTVLVVYNRHGILR